MLRDPLKVEVNGRPEDVSDPRAVLLFRSKKPLGIFDQDKCTERRAI
jgi:hypothetical protein